MAKKEEQISSGSPSTHITQIKDGSVVRGNIKSKDSIRVDGHVTGDLISSGKIIIGHNGEITGNVKASEVTVDGFVNGDVIAKNTLQVTAGAKLYGKIYSKEISIEKGAELNGKVSIGANVDFPEISTSSSSRKIETPNYPKKETISGNNETEKGDGYGSIAW